MGNRKQPKPIPPGTIKPDPPPAPPLKIHLVKCPNCGGRNSHYFKPPQGSDGFYLCEGTI